MMPAAKTPEFRHWALDLVAIGNPSPTLRRVYKSVRELCAGGWRKTTWIPDVSKGSPVLKNGNWSNCDGKPVCWQRKTRF